MSKKLYLAIFLLIVMIVATGVVIYYALASVAPKEAVPGVHVGDTFTYSLKGNSALFSLDATEPEGFTQYNNTEYYKVIITEVNGSSVSMDTVWRFINGSEVKNKQTINLSTGIGTDQITGFWAIYASNLNQNDLLRPAVTDGIRINGTDTKTYANSTTRQRNTWTLQNEFYDITDPTYSTLREEFITVYFDQETGMLETLTNVQRYNNPAKNLIIIWNLIDSSVWDV